MSEFRLVYSRFRDYLRNDWKTLIAEVSISVDNQVLANASHGIVSTGPNDTDPLNVQLIGLTGHYHELIFPGGTIGGRRIHVRESFPELKAINPNGHFVTAILSPTGWGGDFSHIPSLNSRVLEFTVSTQPGPLPQHGSDPKTKLWLRNSDTLLSYQRTHLSKSRRGTETETSWNRDWLSLELDTATVDL